MGMIRVEIVTLSHYGPQISSLFETKKNFFFDEIRSRVVESVRFVAERVLCVSGLFEPVPAFEDCFCRRPRRLTGT